MSESTLELKLQLAMERGFITEGATDAQIAAGLETMHEAPLSAVGKYLLPETVTIVIPASTPL